MAKIWTHLKFQKSKKLNSTRKLELSNCMVFGFKNYRKQKLIQLYLGEAKLFDGELKGLKSLHRSGNCLLKKETDGFTADVKLELDNLDFHFKAEVKLDKLHKDVLITGHTDMIEVEANAHMNTETNKADLKEFKVLQLKKLHVNIHGLSVLDPILNAFTNVMIEALNPVVKGLLEKEAKNILSEKIKNIKIGE